MLLEFYCAIVYDYTNVFNITFQKCNETTKPSWIQYTTAIYHIRHINDMFTNTAGAWTCFHSNRRTYKYYFWETKFQAVFRFVIIFVLFCLYI